MTEEYVGKIPKTKVLETSPEPRYKRRTGLEPLYLSAYELERFADPRLFSMLLGTGIHGGISMISLDQMRRQLYPGLEDNELSLLTLYHTELSHLPSYALLALRSLDISPEGDILCSAIETQGGDQLPLRVSSGVEIIRPQNVPHIQLHTSAGTIGRAPYIRWLAIQACIDNETYQGAAHDLAGSIRHYSDLFPANRRYLRRDGTLSDGENTLRQLLSDRGEVMGCMETDGINITKEPQTMFNAAELIGGMRGVVERLREIVNSSLDNPDQSRNLPSGINLTLVLLQYLNNRMRQCSGTLDYSLDDQTNISETEIRVVFSQIDQQFKSIAGNMTALDQRHREQVQQLQSLVDNLTDKLPCSLCPLSPFRRDTESTTGTNERYSHAPLLAPCPLANVPTIETDFETIFENANSGPNMAQFYIDLVQEIGYSAFEDIHRIIYARRNDRHNYYIFPDFYNVASEDDETHRLYNPAITEDVIAELPETYSWSPTGINDITAMIANDPETSDLIAQFHERLYPNLAHSFEESEPDVICERHNPMRDQGLQELGAQIFMRILEGRAEELNFELKTSLENGFDNRRLGIELMNYLWTRFNFYSIGLERQYRQQNSLLPDAQRLTGQDLDTALRAHLSALFERYVAISSNNTFGVKINIPIIFVGEDNYPEFRKDLLQRYRDGNYSLTNMFDIEISQIPPSMSEYNKKVDSIAIGRLVN